ncbi:MAG: hypothetical protein QME52_06900 [Bacteroidota bacterium]|nr:hypothetical protein [Bacteroidota bacterium]
MPETWITFIDELKDEAGILAKNELKDLILESLKDTEEFIRNQAQKVQRYLNQLALGKITKQQFEGYMVDIADLTRMNALKMEVAAKARAQRLADGIQNFILDRLLKVL